MIEITDNRVGGGTKSIGGGSSEISPDWDVKWPDGDAIGSGSGDSPADGWEGF